MDHIIKFRRVYIHVYGESLRFWPIFCFRCYLQFMTTRLWFIGCIYRLLSSKNFHLSFTLHFAFFFFVVVEKLGLVFKQTCTWKFCIHSCFATFYIVFIQWLFGCSIYNCWEGNTNGTHFSIIGNSLRKKYVCFHELWNFR